MDLSFQSFVSCYDADWRLLVCFGPTNRRAKNIGIGHGLFTQRCRGNALALVESFAKLAIASPLLIFLPTLSLFPIIFFPVTSETFSRSEIAEQRLMVLRIFRSDAVLSILTFSNQPVRSLAHVEPDRLPVGASRKLAMEVVERKQVKSLKSKNDARKV